MDLKTLPTVNGVPVALSTDIVPSSGSLIAGQRGQDGATWLIGYVLPQASQGNVNDLYLCSTTGDVYRKQVAAFGMPPAWVKCGNITGPQGTTGAQGVQGLQGLPGPVNLAAPTVVGLTYRNLVIANNSGTPNTKVNVTADEVLLKDGDGGLAVLHINVSVTINTGATGVNGIDTGSQAASTWYYIWGISNGSTFAGLISTSSTAPTMPSGYTYKQLLGAVYSDGSTHFVKFYQTNNFVSVALTNVFTSKAGVLSFTSQSVSTIVPPNATTFSGICGTSVSNGGGAAITIAGDTNGVGETGHIGYVFGSGLDSFISGSYFTAPLITAQTFYWKTEATTAVYRVSVSGFTL